MLTPHWNLGGTEGCGLFAQLTETCVTLLTIEFLYYPKSWDWDTASQVGTSLPSDLGYLVSFSSCLALLCPPGA